MNKEESHERMLIANDLLFRVVKELVDERKSVMIKPTGNSMLPFIRGGLDNVVLKVPDRELEAGDIVLFKTGERYIIHRICKIEGERITAMGDGNLNAKEQFSRSDVIGIVTEIVKDGGRHVKPGKATLWRTLLPARRILLAFYKRVILR